MIFFWLFCSLAAAAIPLTIELPANTEKCFYAQAHHAGAKIRLSFTVMAGGNFDVDAVFSRPDNAVLEKWSRSQGDELVATAQQPGEYELCFNNDMSTVGGKKIEFEFEVDSNSITAELPPTVGEGQTDKIEEYLAKLDRQASEISRSLQYYKTRNLRNESTVRSTSSRIWWYCVIELLAIISMALLNVFIVQYFFKGSRKALV